MDDRPSDDGGGLPALADVDSRPLCLICGEPALYDMSTLHRQPGAALWVCNDHIGSPDRIEVTLALRELERGLREAYDPLFRLSEWVLARAAALLARLT